jgi:asparagine synthase (glutamine-hydrolysing)
MCGISGVVGLANGDAGERVARMNKALARRGPNSEGLHSWPSTVLGHRRLSIFDLSDAGRQPMISADGKVGIVFNGAIFNFRQLRVELEALGHSFVSQTDTEVLVEGYRAWGIEKLLPRLRGMFAFALWDQNLGKLWLVRDRLGVKPLLYAISGRSLAFASTARALQEAGFAGPVDPAAVLEFLEFAFVTDERSIFEGICKVPAGHVVEWHDGQLRQWAYWTLPSVDPDSRITFNEAVEQTESLFLEAVRLRLDADVPVGCLLSGGIDSALVCWGVAQFNPKLTAFTIGMQGNAADEAGAAAETARWLGIPHQTVEISPDQPKLLDSLIPAYGEPFACSSALGMIAISEAICPHATVLLTGDGGDDVFLGYRTHRIFYKAQQLANQLPVSARPLWRMLRPLASAFSPLRRGARFIDYSTDGVSAVYKAHDGLPWFENLGLLGPRLQALSLRHRQIPSSIFSARQILTDFLKWEQDNRFVSEFLTKVDGGAMYHALEARSPLLDQNVWEFAARLPYSVRLHDGKLKAILRELARRRVHPDVATRRKQGFTIPVEEWLLTRWRSRLLELSSEPLVERDGWIAKGGFARAIEEGDRQGRAPVQLWSLTVLESWLRALQGAYKT